MKEQVQKVLAVGVGLIIGVSGGMVAVSEAPKLFESSNQRSLKGLGYEITPYMDQNTLVLSTDSFPGWASFLTNVPLELARMRIVRACKSTVYEPTHPEYITDQNSQVRLVQIFQTKDRNSCFPSEYY